MEIFGIIFVLGVIVYVIANVNKSGTDTADNNNPYSSWTDQKLWDFLVENGAKKNRLMIDATFNDALKPEYEKLDAKLVLRQMYCEFSLDVREFCFSTTPTPS